MTLEQIAIATGFSHRERLSSVFKLVTSQTPGDYRSEHTIRDGRESRALMCNRVTGVIPNECILKGGTFPDVHSLLKKVCIKFFCGLPNLVGARMSIGIPRFCWRYCQRVSKTIFDGRAQSLAIARSTAVKEYIPLNRHSLWIRAGPLSRGLQSTGKTVVSAVH